MTMARSITKTTKTLTEYASTLGGEAPVIHRREDRDYFEGYYFGRVYLGTTAQEARNEITRYFQRCRHTNKA